MKYNLKIKFLGASGTVTGSSYFLSNDSGRGIIIDLGMFQGTSREDTLNRGDYKVDISKVDAVLLTHAHLDHCGRLPILFKKGFRGKIFATAATRDLAELVLIDSAKIAEYEKEITPLYTGKDAINTINLFETIDYHKEFVVGDFAISAFDAGHLLGSASFVITNGKVKITFSGDLGNSPQTLVRPTESIHSSDIVIMETTYGAREHQREKPMDVLQREINEVEKTNGTLLIPSFSLNRAQDLLYKIKILKKSGKVKKATPVLMDSPMGDSATQIHLKHKGILSEQISQELKNGDPFSFPGLTIRRRGKKNILKKMRGAKIIVAGSGMMTGGRIVNHSKEFLPRKNTRLLIVGYQGEGTLGRELLEGAKMVDIEGKKIQMNASLREIQGMSSHAGRTPLLNWLKKIKGVQKVFLTHGDNEGRASFEKYIKNKTHINNITLPKLNEEHPLL